VCDFYWLRILQNEGGSASAAVSLPAMKELLFSNDQRRGFLHYVGCQLRSLTFTYVFSYMSDARRNEQSFPAIKGSGWFALKQILYRTLQDISDFFPWMGVFDRNGAWLEIDTRLNDFSPRDIDVSLDQVSPLECILLRLRIQGPARAYNEKGNCNVTGKGHFIFLCFDTGCCVSLLTEASIINTNMSIPAQYRRCVRKTEYCKQL
jgi:hypothetical protein